MQEIFESIPTLLGLLIIGGIIGAGFNICLFWIEWTRSDFKSFCLLKFKDIFLSLDLYLYIFLRKRTLSYSGLMGKIGELGVFRMLEKYNRKYPGGKILGNLYLPIDGNIQHSQIDILFIHPHGIYVIEVKNTGGTISGKSTSPQWSIKYQDSSSYLTPNPVSQNENHRKVIKRYLSDSRFPISAVWGFVIYANDCDISQVKNDYLFLKKDLMKKIHPITHYSKSDIEKIYHYFLQYKGTKEIEKNHIKQIYEIYR